MAPPFCLGQWHPMTQSSTAPGLGWGAPGTWWISSGTYGVGCFSSPIQEIKIHVQRKISRDAISSSQGSGRPPSPSDWLNPLYPEPFLLNVFEPSCKYVIVQQVV